MAALAVPAVLAIGLGAQAFAQQDEAQEGVSDEELVDRLAEIDQQLPDLPPEDVEIDPEETWADVTGDFTGAQIQLETLLGDIRALFVDADDADGDVADAVSDTARSLLLLHEAYVDLSEWEGHDLSLPLDDSDGDDVATGADELYGVAESGLSLVLQARELSRPAYEVLAGSEAADPDEQERFDQRRQAADAFHSEQRPLIRRALSERTTQVLVPVDRFDTADPGDEARARSMTLVCVERDEYDELVGADAPTDAATEGRLDERLAELDSDPTVDCPDLPEDNDARPTG